MLENDGLQRYQALKSVAQAGNGSAQASTGRARATRRHVLAQMQARQAWVQRSGSWALVLVQAAEHGEGDDLARPRRLHLGR